MVQHIHQPGTTNTFCGLDIAGTPDLLSWQEAHLSKCDDCLGSLISGPYIQG